MGSSQSQPSQSANSRPRLRSAPSSRSTTSNVNSPGTSITETPRPSRFSSFRRLSSFGRRDLSKRHRGSTSTIDQSEPTGSERKKQRVTESSLPPPIEVPSPPSPRLEAPLPVSSPPLSEDPLPYSQPAAPIQSPPSYSPPLTGPTPAAETPGSPDALLPDRLRTLSTIRETLGPDWSSNAANASTAQERLRDLQRRSVSSISNQESNETGRVTDRIYNLLGLTPPGQSRSLSTSPLPSPALNSSTLDPISTSVEEDSDAALEDLTRRLESARASLADARRNLEGMEAAQSGGNEHTMTNAAGGIGNQNPLLAPTGGRGIPAGAVLIIQGLAQTQAVQTGGDPPNGDAGPGSPLGGMARHIPGLRARSSSEGNVRSPSNRSTPASRSNAGTPRPDGDASGTPSSVEDEPSVQGQARMISGLLTVAATATATTLLAPASVVSGPRQNSNPLSSLLDRIRPQRRTAPTVEAALGNYLRNALRSQPNSPSSPSGLGSRPSLSRRNTSTPTSPSVGSDVPDDFQHFLEGLQEDILGAVTRFTSPPAIEPETPAVPAETSGRMADPPQIPSLDQTSVDVEMSGQTPPSLSIDTTDAVFEQSSSDAQELNIAPVPSFHRQLGQNRPDDPDRRYGLSGGTDGQPRRLNFFRAHMFPPIQSSNTSGETTGQDDPEGMVPAIFVGVRSLAHDPTMTTDDLVSHPNFPFTDGNVPPSPSPGSPVIRPGGNGGNSQLEDAQENVPLTPVSSAPESVTRPPAQRAWTERPPTPHPSSPAPSADRRSLRERFLDRLVPRRPETPRSPTSTILNTYLVFVIGGYYPRSHPVLSIPNLVTGGPLTDEEMSLISELMGPGKPPTASKEDIEKSGLAVISGSEIQRLGEEGKILENCLERCLVCLGDYEPEEDCRVLKCRHAFHKECVDHWLSSGRNSCPACRTEAVDVKKNETGATAGGAEVPAASVPVAEDERLLNEVD